MDGKKIMKEPEFNDKPILSYTVGIYVDSKLCDVYLIHVINLNFKV